MDTQLSLHSINVKTETCYLIARLGLENWPFLNVMKICSMCVVVATVRMRTPRWWRRNCDDRRVPNKRWVSSTLLWPQRPLDEVAWDNFFPSFRWCCKISFDHLFRLQISLFRYRHAPLTCGIPKLNWNPAEMGKASNNEPLMSKVSIRFPFMSIRFILR